MRGPGGSHSPENLLVMWALTCVPEPEDELPMSEGRQVPGDVGRDHRRPRESQRNRCPGRQIRERPWRREPVA